MNGEMRILTPNELNKLPRCQYDEFARCDKTTPSKDFCAACVIEGMEKALYQENLALAMHFLDMLTMRINPLKLVKE